MWTHVERSLADIVHGVSCIDVVEIGIVSVAWLDRIDECENRKWCGVLQ